MGGARSMHYIYVYERHIIL